MHPEPFLTGFQFFLLSLLQTKLLVLMADPSVRIDSYELYLLRMGDGIFKDKILYLEPSGIGCKKFEKSAPRIIFAQLSIF